MTAGGHNPYVGIQRTVFEQGWQRALKEVEKHLTELVNAPGIEEWCTVGLRDAIQAVEKLRND